MKREKNCCWHFGSEGPRDNGPNNISEMTFSGGPYTTLIREALQNSIDAVLDKTKPVVVTIEMKSLRMNDFRNFFHLKEHIKACIDYFGKSANCYKPMLDYFGKGSLSTEIGYIKVSDSNTTGMRYVNNDTDCGFYAFALAHGVSVKEVNSSGGSFGFGKTAYFQMSPIRTIFVSSCFKKNQNADKEYAFIGITDLCTHSINNEKKASVGYYYNENESDDKAVPVTNFDEIPVPFRHEEQGTSICILGLDVDEKSKEKDKKTMIEAVLRNYWLAIWEEKLEVKILDTTINKGNITELMEKTFISDLDVHKKNRYNPRPYFDAIRFAKSEDKDDCILTKDKLRIINEVELYLKKNSNAQDRIVYMRQNLMYIYSKRQPTKYGYNALFICRSDRGNQLLKELENPRHDEWKNKNRITKLKLRPNTKNYNLGEEVLQTIDTFINNYIKKIFSSESVDSMDIAGLEEYLYIVDDLISDESSTAQSNADTWLGNPTGVAQDDGSLPTIKINNPANVDKRENSQLGHVIVTRYGSNTLDEKKGQPIGVGHTHTSTGKKPKNPKGSNQLQIAIPDLFGEGSYWEYAPVKYRVVAQKKDNKMYHDIIIHSDVTIESGRIELVVGGEQTDEIIQLLETNIGIIRDNFVEGLKINKGRNVIRIRFNDNLKHVVILKAYESKK